MERQILHIDVNNAFLSWTAIEMLKEGAQADLTANQLTLATAKQTLTYKLADLMN